MAADMLSFSPDARRRIDVELLDDEEILWASGGHADSPPSLPCS
ncbi:MAG: hypothetical protein ACOCVI_01260 [Planctomycetota bacterium]